MRRKHKALVLLALLLLFGTVASACSGKMVHEQETYAETAEEADQEEVLSSDSDEFGRTDFSTPDGKASGFFVSVGYLAMMIGSTVLPLLFL